MLGFYPVAGAPLGDIGSLPTSHADGAATLPMFTAAASATVKPIAAGAASLPALRAAALASAPATARGSAVLPMFTASALAKALVAANVDALLPMFRLAARIKVSTPRPVSSWSKPARPASIFDACEGERQGSLDDFGGVGGPHRGAPQEFSVSIRETQADFTTPDHSVQGASVVRRPDAISLDYLTAVTLGPIALGDTSAGPVVCAWKVRDDNKTIRICRANPANTDWEAETVLFTYTGSPILELDYAFEQAGRPVVVAERADGIWVYWFDPTLGDFTFAHLGAGRTPRAILDDQDAQSTTSDVLLFYINNDAGATGAVCYRMQRERYLIEHVTPIVGGATINVHVGSDGSIGPYADVVGTTNGVTVEAPPGYVSNGVMNGSTPVIPAVTHHAVVGPAGYPTSEPWYGDFQLRPPGPTGGFGALDGFTVLTFSEPITTFRLRAHYPSGPFNVVGFGGFQAGNHATMYALTDASHIDTFGSFTTLPLAQAAWGVDFNSRSAWADSDERTLNVPGGFSCVVIKGSAQHPGLDITFSHMIFKTLRDMSDPSVSVTLPAIEQMYVEDAVKSRGGRVVVLFSVRDTDHATYSLQSLASALYPIKTTENMRAANPTVTAGSLRKALLTVGIGEPDGRTDAESMQAFVATLTGGDLHTVLLIVDPANESNVTTGQPSLRGGELRVALIAYDAGNEQMLTTNPPLTGGSLALVVIVPNTTPDEMTSSNPLLVGGSLA